jgi:hypothetical protein
VDDAAERQWGGGVTTMLGADILELLVLTFRELRAGLTADGKALERPSAAMSTAEAVSVAYAVGVRAHFLGDGPATPADLVDCLSGAAVKGDKDDLLRLRHYFEQRIAKIDRPHFQAYYQARHRLEG